MMRYLCGLFSWILGGLLLESGMATASLWIGWFALAGGTMLFLPALWKLETNSTPTQTRYLLRAPYLGGGMFFAACALVSIWTMGQSMTAGFAGESLMLAMTSILLFATVDELVSPLARHVRELELDGRPQPIGFNVLEVARDLGGRLTPAELAADFGVDYVHARDTLMSLLAEGACERVVTRNGAVVFRFPELETDKVDLLEE